MGFADAHRTVEYKISCIVYLEFSHFDLHYLYTSTSLSDSCDVMDMMTGLRKEWGMKYPGEEW